MNGGYGGGSGNMLAQVGQGGSGGEYFFGKGWNGLPKTNSRMNRRRIGLLNRKFGKWTGGQGHMMHQCWHYTGDIKL